MGISPTRIKVIARREMARYLSSPTGYVFITLFIAMTAAAAFLQQQFFARNLADLAALNRWMPEICMLFVPAITMTSWAEERLKGTDELLMTLPLRDEEVVIGKFLGALGVFTVALAFSTSHIIVLDWLGEPDLGLLAGTYAGYWLLGAAFTAVALIASMLSENLTVAFVLGVLATGTFVAAGTTPWAASMVAVSAVAALSALSWWTLRGQLPGTGRTALIASITAIGLWFSFPESWSSHASAIFDVGSRLASFGEGVISMGDLAFFLGIVVSSLYLCFLLLERRTW